MTVQAGYQHTGSCFDCVSGSASLVTARKKMHYLGLVEKGAGDAVPRFTTSCQEAKYTNNNSLFIPR